MGALAPQLAIVGALWLAAAPAPAAPLSAADLPLLQQALTKATAAELAEAALFVDTVLAEIPLVRRGGTLILRGGEVKPGGSRAVEAELRRRRTIYGTAIEQRGFRSLAGRYRVVATPACARLPSALARGVAAGVLEQLELGQQGSQLTLVSPSPSPSPSSSSSPSESSAPLLSSPAPVPPPFSPAPPPPLLLRGVVVESVLRVAERVDLPRPGVSLVMSFLGRVAPEKLVLHPNAEGLLAVWPRQPGLPPPPSRDDLEACVLTLRTGMAPPSPAPQALVPGRATPAAIPAG
ncbi:MAG: hypothetical protein ACK5JJ_15515 [Cyanobacteriota bacterium]|jgi:hypothetical protein